MSHDKQKLRDIRQHMSHLKKKLTLQISPLVHLAKTFTVHSLLHLAREIYFIEGRVNYFLGIVLAILGEK